MENKTLNKFMPEKMSSIEKVIGKGLSEEEKAWIMRSYEEKFDNQKFEELRDLEREKTAEELEIISLANEKTNELLEKFGLKKFDIPAKNIHVVSKEKWIGGRVPAFFKYDEQAVVMRAEDWKIIFADNIFHEMLHFKSGTTLLAKEGKEGIVFKPRLGFRIYEKNFGREYFANLNEAITEELAKRMTIVSSTENPLFQDEINKMKKMYKEHPQLITNDTLTLKVSPPDATGETKLERHSFPYGRHRNILNTLIDKLYEKNKDEFKEREDVFNLFAKAMFEGNIIEVGHLVDTTFGKGTMRTIGEFEDNINGQENYVKLL